MVSGSFYKIQTIKKNSIGSITKLAKTMRLGSIFNSETKSRVVHRSPRLTTLGSTIIEMKKWPGQAWDTLYIITSWEGTCSTGQWGKEKGLKDALPGQHWQTLYGTIKNVSSDRIIRWSTSSYPLWLRVSRSMILQDRVKPVLSQFNALGPTTVMYKAVCYATITVNLRFILQI